MKTLTCSIYTAVALSISLLAISGAAQAALIDRGGGLIYDDDLNVTWLSDANYAKTSGYSANGIMNWNQSITWAANLSYYDSVRNVTYTDWRLPFATNCTNTCPGSEMSHLFWNEFGGSEGWYGWTASSSYQLFQNYSLFGDYWSGTGEATTAFYSNRGTQMSSYKNNGMYALAVRNGDVATVVTTVPAPGAFWLLGSGLLGLARWRLARQY